MSIDATGARASAGGPAWHYELHNHSQSSHQQIARLVRRIGRGPVLDVGAAQGALGRLLADTGLVFDAVEPHPVWAEHARQHYRNVYASGIEAAALPENTYATVVCADVLEHTVSPSAALQHLLRAATPDAAFVISLPNVAHLSGRLFLLAGHFPKMERGIFDRTHLHFFTRATAVELLRANGLEPALVRPTPVPLEQVWPERFGRSPLAALMAAQRAALLLAPTLFAFQWVIVAKRTT